MPPFTVTLIDPSFAPGKDSSITMPEIERAVGSAIITETESQQPFVVSETIQV